MRKQQGTVNLAVSLVILSAMTLTLLYSSNSVLVEQRIYSNLYQAEQAEAAAQAGLEYGARYLLQNKATIVIDPDANGYISPAAVTGALNNSSTYSIVYSNPTINNFNTIKMVVTGTSSDGSSQKSFSQILEWRPVLNYSPPLSVTVKGETRLRNISSVLNLQATRTIWSGGIIDFDNSSFSIGLGGISTRFITGGDVLASYAALASATADGFFSNFFGASKSVVSGSANLYYQNSTSTNYNSALTGRTNTVIWIEQTSGTATIDSSTVIGSTSEPVLLIVNGELDLANSATIYGVIYVSQAATSTFELKNSAQVIGAVIMEGQFEMNNTTNVSYSSTVVNNVKNNLGNYERVAGSWNNLNL